MYFSVIALCLAYIEENIFFFKIQTNLFLLTPEQQKLAQNSHYKFLNVYAWIFMMC